LRKKNSKKPKEIDEKRLKNFKTLKNTLNFKLIIFSLGFHVPAPPCPAPQPSSDEILKNKKH
jgi:hypothetical protein